MAESEGERAGGAVERAINLADHPILFALAITFLVIAMSAFLYWGFVRLGMPGPASLFH